MSGDGRHVEMLPWVETWWKQTQNPLYAWEALARCLAPDAPEQPLPDFVREYFRDAAVKMLALSHGCHWETDARVEPEDALKLVGEALGLWRKRSKNAFARRRDDGVAARTALDDEFFKGPPADAVRTIEKDDADQRRINGKWLSSDRAKRIVVRGRKLNHPSR